MANCQAIRSAFNTVSQLAHELYQGQHDCDQLALLEYHNTLKLLYERYERERKQIWLPTWADRNAPFISTVATFIDGKHDFVRPPPALLRPPAPPPSLDTPINNAEGQAFLKRHGDNVMFYLSSGKYVANPNCPAIKEQLAKQMAAALNEPTKKSYERVA